MLGSAIPERFPLVSVIPKTSHWFLALPQVSNGFWDFQKFLLVSGIPYRSHWFLGFPEVLAGFWDLTGF